MSRKTTVEQIHFGPEPTNPIGFKYSEALNWYFLVKNSKDSRKYMIDWLKKNKRTKDLKIVQAMNDSDFPNTLGWVARILSNDLEIPEKEMKWFDNKTKELLKENAHLVKKTSNNTPSTPKVSPIENMKKNLRENIIGELDGVIDARDTDFNVVEFLVQQGVQPKTASLIPTFYENDLEEINAALKNDKTIKEYYNLPVRELKKLKSVITHIITECNRYVDAAKPRRKSSKKITNKLKGLRYLQESAEYGVKSVKPDKLLTANIVYAFETSNRRLYEIHAKDNDGIWVKGVSFQNIDEEKSTGKVLPQKDANNIVQKLTKGGKRAASNTYNKINRKPGGCIKRSTDTLIILNTF